MAPEMNRRELLRAGVVAVAAAAVARPLVAAQPAGLSVRLNLDAYSRTLHWLRTPGEVAEACHEIGNTTIDLTVRPGSGHVDPAKVATDLPAFMKGLRAGGVEVSMITPNITEAEDANAEATLDAASALGIHYYWWGAFRLDETKPYWPQLDALKTKVEKIAKLNEKYSMKAMAHPRDGAASVSGAFFDLLYVLKDFDPRWVRFQYDTHHLAQAFDSGWVQIITIRYRKVSLKNLRFRFMATPVLGGLLGRIVEPDQSFEKAWAHRFVICPSHARPSFQIGPYLSLVVLIVITVGASALRAARGKAPVVEGCRLQWVFL